MFGEVFIPWSSVSRTNAAVTLEFDVVFVGETLWAAIRCTNKIERHIADKAREKLKEAMLDVRRISPVLQMLGDDPHIHLDGCEILVSTK